MALIWMQSLSTGVDWQDRQHKDLFNKINEFIDAMNKGKGKEELSTLFRFLDTYVREHFRNEETAMDTRKYPSLTAHKDQHRKFMDNMSRIKKDFEKEGAHTHVIEARKLLADWFYEHVQKVDKGLGSFLTAAM